MEVSANISYLFNEVPLLDRPQAARAADFKTIDVTSPFDASPEDWKQALKGARSRLMSFDLPMGDFHQGGEGLLADPAQQEAFETAMARSLEYADALKVDSINVVSGRCTSTQTGKAWQTMIERCTLLADELEKREMHLTIEPLNTQDFTKVMVFNVETALDFISDVDRANVAMQIDIYEMHMMEPGLTEKLRVKAKWIRRVQLSDFPKRNEPGSGNMNLIDIERALMEGGYRGWLSAAYEPTGSTQDSLNWLSTLSAVALSERLQS